MEVFMLKLLSTCYLLIFCCCILSAAVPTHLVTGENLSKLEKIAVEELQLFYKKIYKKELQMLTSENAAGKNVIYLGDTAFARKNGIDSNACGNEEWILKNVGKNLIIAGGRPAGTLYGVYELLERLGVVFTAPDETFIPAGKPDFPVFNEKKQPAFEGRLVFDGIPYQLVRSKGSKADMKAYSLWVLRNRGNGQQIAEVPSLYMGMYFNVPHYPYHNLFDYLPRSLYATHPEYFQMDAMGRRNKPLQHRFRGGICMSNADVRRIVLDSLRKKIKSDRKKFPKEEWPRIYDISRLDDTPIHCLCPTCKAVSAREESGTEEGLLFDFINHIAREIRKEYPDIIIRTFGEKTAPQKIKPEKNVLVWIEDLFSRHTPFVATENTTNAVVKKYREGWFKLNGPFLMWDYWNLGNAYFTPPRVETVFDTIKPDFQYFLKNKVRALFIEASIDPASPQNFIMVNYYIAMQLMVKPDADPEVLADKFFKSYYGKAYPVMKKYFNAIRSGVRNQPQYGATSCGAAHWNYLTPEFMVNMYRDLHKAQASVSPHSEYARRIRRELVTPLWYALVNWDSYADAFTKIGITRDKLIAECRKHSREYIHSFGPRPQWQRDNFEKRFQSVCLNLPRPEKFKNVPAKNFKMLSFADFKQIDKFNAKVVNDPDSITGKAVKSADPRPERHGINKLIDKKHNFFSTQFVLGNHRAPGQVKVYLKEVAQDEKYHWYRIPGTIELRAVSDFWGHGWAIQAPANRFFLLTTGDPADNTWDQVWFSAKFTGPAYVPGSKKENAIFVDMTVLTRGEKENQFQPVPGYGSFSAKDKTGLLPAGWKLVRYYQPSGNTKMIKNKGIDAIHITGHPKKVTAIEGPKFPCGPKDVLKVKARISGKCSIGLYLYNKKGFTGGQFIPAKSTGTAEEYIFTISDLPKTEENTGCSLAFRLLPGAKEAAIDQLEVSKAENLNVF